MLSWELGMVALVPAWTIPVMYPQRGGLVWLLFWKCQQDQIHRLVFWEVPTCLTSCMPGGPRANGVAGLKTTILAMWYYLPNLECGKLEMLACRKVKSETCRMGNTCIPSLSVVHDFLLGHLMHVLTFHPYI